jgi:hypothetical protein
LNGQCFINALREAKIKIPKRLSIPDWIPIEEIPKTCAILGLEWLGTGCHKIGVEPVIVLYQTINNKTGHAVFVEDIGALLGRVSIIGVIRLN